MLYTSPWSRFELTTSVLIGFRVVPVPNQSGPSRSDPCRSASVFHYCVYMSFFLKYIIYFRFCNISVWWGVTFRKEIKSWQLSMPSVPITTNVSLNLTQAIQHYVIVCQWLVTGQWFSPGTPVSSTNKTDCHIKVKYWRQKIIFFSIAEGGAKIFGVFRVKNHDFTPKNHIFFQF